MHKHTTMATGRASLCALVLRFINDVRVMLQGDRIILKILSRL
jgi:hypothetical protein